MGRNRNYLTLLCLLALANIIVSIMNLYFLDLVFGDVIGGDDFLRTAWIIFESSFNIMGVSPFDSTGILPEYGMTLVY